MWGWVKAQDYTHGVGAGEGRRMDGVAPSSPRLVLWEGAVGVDGVREVVSGTVIGIDAVGQSEAV